MKRLIFGICLCLLSTSGCGGNSAPAKPEAFAPPPTSAPGASEGGNKSKKKNDSKMSAPIEVGS